MANTHPGGLALGVAMALVATGCARGGTTHGAAPNQPSTSPAPSSTTLAPNVPNPFTVVARYSAASLSLKRLKACNHGPCTEELAVGPDGNLYVTDSVTSTVTVVSPAGKVLRRWGGPGKGPGEFHFVLRGDVKDPTDIDASITVGPDGKVYVTDSGNGRIEVFSPDGRFIRQVGSEGVEDGQFLLPYDAAVDQQGDLFVVDQASNTISKFSPSGKFVWQIGGDMSNDPELSQTEFHLGGVDSHGRVVAGASDARSIVYIDGSGHKVDSFPVSGFPLAGLGPCSVSLDQAGYTFVESCGYVGESGGQTAPPDQTVLVFDRSHRLVGAWYDSPLAVAPKFGPNGEAFGLGADGSILKLKVALPGA